LRAGVVSSPCARRDRLPLRRRRSRRVGAATPRGARGTRDVSRASGRVANHRPRPPRDLFGQRDLLRPSRAARAAAGARDNDR